MALRSWYAQNAAHEDALQALLEGRYSWIKPNQIYLEAAYHLGQLGFIQLKEHYFIKCANPLDALDFDGLINPDCENKIPIPDDFDESCDDLICEECGRYILPITQQKQRFHVVSLSLQKQAIVQWFEAELREFVFKNQSAGVYHVLLDSGFVTMVLPDFIDNPSYLAIDRIKAQPTLIITLRKSLPHLPIDITTIRLSDLMSERLSLQQGLHMAMEHGIPKEIPNVSRQILPFIPLHQPKIAEKPITYSITIDSEGIFVGGIHVIGKQAPSRIQIFRILLEQYWRDFEEGKPKDMHTPLNLHQIAECLEPHMGLIDDLEQQIRRPLNKMQKAIEETLAKELGVNIKRDDIIQTLGWPGFKKQEYGYRLNPFNLVFTK
jgi:hypothetical protein